MADTTEVLPYAVYEPRNLGSTRAYVYLGKNVSDGIKTFETFAGDERTSENCLTVLMFASIIGGKQVRVDTWTDKDPHTFIDQRFYDLRPFRYLKSWNNTYNPPTNMKLQDYIDSLEGVVDETLPYNSSIYQRGETYLNNFDPVYYIRRLTSDGSVVINANYGRFWWGENADENGEKVNVSPDDQLLLQAHEYKLKCDEAVYNCWGESICPIKEIKVDSTRNGFTYVLRDLQPGKDIAIFEYDRWVNARDGLVFEDLSDLLPEGVQQISQWKECGCKFTGNGDENVLCNNDWIL
jgi:hypothetical protein